MAGERQNSLAWLTAHFGLSAVQAERLAQFVEALLHWQARINLISPDSIATLWHRHVYDSLQLMQFIASAPGICVDLGSGGGFPAIPLAIVGADLPGFEMHMVESNRKKAVFLGEMLRLSGADGAVHANRLEALVAEKISPAGSVGIRYITARGFAPLPRLLEGSAGLVGQQTEFLLLKGQDVEEELTAATKYWNIGCVKHRSMSDPGGCVLQITEISRA